jgi:molybdate transport system ATP-binding protein
MVLGGRSVLDVDALGVAPGDKWAVLGPNGAGKTQLMKLLAGTRWPTPTGRERRRWFDARGRDVELVDARDDIAYVGAESQDRYQRHGWNFTLAEVVATGIFRTDIPLDVPGAAELRRVRHLLAQLDLAAVAGRRMLEVSYGQRRLALIARALASRPGLLLLDEAYNGLDGGHREALDRALGRLLRGRVTLVLTAHRHEDLPAGMTRLALVAGGRVHYAGRYSAARARRALAAPVPARAVARRRAADRGAAASIVLERASVYRDGRPVLRQLDWRLRDGEHWAVAGRNGSGKTTFLGLLYGIHPVALGGRLLRRDHPPGTPLEEIRNDIALVSPELQTRYDPHCTVEEIVVSGLHNSIGLDAPPTRAERARAARWLVPLGIDHLAQRRPAELSYGEMRLVLFARAFVREPRLLLLDEPFTGLDPGRRRQLKQALALLARAGTQLVVAVHHRDDLLPEITRVLRLAHRRGTSGRL